MSLVDSLLYEEDINFVKIYDKLSNQLKIVHNNNLIVDNLNLNSINYDNEVIFNGILEPNDFENEKINNIVSLAKIMIGLELSKETGFRDFSNVDNSWFIANLDNIFSVITDENFDKEYFERVLINKEPIYFCDYLNNKKNAEELSERSNTTTYKKVLRTAASSLYQDVSEENQPDIQQKAAHISTTFNPVLIGIILIIITLIITFVSLIC